MKLKVEADQVTTGQFIQAILVPQIGQWKESEGKRDAAKK